MWMMSCVEGGTHGILYCRLVAPSELNQNLAVVGETSDRPAIPKSWPLANIGVATFQSTDEFVLGLSKKKPITLRIIGPETTSQPLVNPHFCPMALCPCPGHLGRA